MQAEGVLPADIVKIVKQIKIKMKAIKKDIIEKIEYYSDKAEKSQLKKSDLENVRYLCDLLQTVEKTCAIMAQDGSMQRQRQPVASV